MDNMRISTEPNFLDVELPQTLIESPSVSTFLPDEEASMCPLLSNSSNLGPLTLSHPLSPNCIENDITSSNISNTDCKAETSSSGSSTGIAMDAPESASTNLFNKLNYQHLQNNNINADQDSKNHCMKGNGNLSKETPSFVSWNWPLIRKCTFFVFISALLAMCSIVVAKITSLPKSCNPKTAWYRGSVFYEIFPPSFQDSDNDGIGDIGGIINRVDYLASLGVSAIRLNSIFVSDHYPDDYNNATSISQISPVVGKLNDVKNLVEALHERNIGLILDLPVQQALGNLNKKQNEDVFDDIITAALLQWVKCGVNGFYLKGLEKHSKDFELAKFLALWKRVVGNDIILIVEEAFLKGKSKIELDLIYQHIDLVDFRVDVGQGTKSIEKRIEDILTNVLPPSEDGAWVHWSIGGEDSTKRISRGADSDKIALASTIMQLMLPGTPSIFYGDEIAIESAVDPHNEHGETKHLHHLVPMVWPNATHQFTNHKTLPWIPKTSSHNFDNLKAVTTMIALRHRSPSLYKSIICKPNINSPNTQIRHSHDDILLIERSYPRRNSFVSITNLGSKKVTLDLTSLFYSGDEMLTLEIKEKIYFRKFEIGPLMTIVVKLDK